MASILPVPGFLSYLCNDIVGRGALGKKIVFIDKFELVSGVAVTSIRR